jgi:hypothetical protein
MYYAGACLSGWSNCTNIIHPPNLECLGPEVQGKLNKFISHLYLFDLQTMPRFGIEGNLRPFLQTVTGSILRFHEDFIAQYGPLHRLNTKFFHAARKAEVGSTDSNFLVKTNSPGFHERNIDIHVSGNDNRILLEGLLEEVSKQNQLNKQIVQLNTLVLKKQDDLNSTLLQLEVVFQATIRDLQQSLDAFAKHLNERKHSPTEHNSSESKSPQLEADYNQQQNESFSGTSSNTQLVVDMELETEQPSIKESKPVWQLQNIVSDIPMDTKNLEIKNSVKYHYESKHFHPSKSGKFTMISPPTFYKSKDKSKHRLLMKFFQIVWENDSEKFLIFLVKI